MRYRLRIAVVVSLAVGFGSCGALAQLAAFAKTEIGIDFATPWPDAVAIELDLGAEYSLDEWTFGAELFVVDGGMRDLALVTTGRLGPLNVYSMYGVWDASSWFTWSDCDNAVWADMLGAEMWALFSIETDSWFALVGGGAGFALGGHGAAGDVEIWGEATFNLQPVLPLVYWNGLEPVLGGNLACDWIQVLDPVCELDFSFANVFVDFPLCCADVGTWISFSCLGFEGFSAWAEGIAIGETGLSIERVEVSFEEESKDFYLWFGIDIGDVVCVSPFVSLIQDAEFTIDGIALDALELVCAVGDVSVTVSELFAPLGPVPFDVCYIGIDGAIHTLSWSELDWTLPAECVEPMIGAEEAIAIEVRRDGCCGESFFGLYSFFDIDLNDSLFSWLGARARAESSISSSVSLFLEAWIWSDGIESLAFGVEITWGELRNLTGDWDCCFGIL